MNLASSFPAPPPSVSFSSIESISAATPGNNSNSNSNNNSNNTNGQKVGSHNSTPASPNLSGAVSSSQSQSHTAIYSSTNSGGIRKRPVHTRHRSISSTHGDRLHQLALEQSAESDQSSQPQQQSPSLNWLTPQHSPEPSAFLQEPAPQYQPPSYNNTWTAPTPPRSDSGLPTVSADVGEEAQTSRPPPPLSSSQQQRRQRHQPAVCSGESPSGNSFGFEQATASPEMSSLGFLLPSQYSSGAYASDNNSAYDVDPNYGPPIRLHAGSSQPPYPSTVSSSPSHYQSRTGSDSRRSEIPPHSSQAAYASGGRRMTAPYDSPQSNDYSMQASQSIPPINGLAPSPMASPAPFSSNMPRPQNMYESGYYSHGYSQSQPPPPPPPMYSSHSSPYHSPYLGHDGGMGKQMPGAASNQRPKPQCWDHGCNGRQFSTFSNLLRHQREKSGTASKSYCPKCGAEFTRTTARNGHVAHDKCTKTTSSRLSEDRQ